MTRGELVKSLILPFLKIAGLRKRIKRRLRLEREFQKNCNVRVEITPLVVGFLDTTPKQFSNKLKDIGITAEIGQVQKTIFLGTARILKKVIKI